MNFAERFKKKLKQAQIPLNYQTLFAETNNNNNNNQCYYIFTLSKDEFNYIMQDNLAYETLVSEAEGSTLLKNFS